ncbi:MAG: glycosyltransferase family 39 protein [Candidatus Omnitrophica bacterium]|nr:glycosyltransferase family 39 protein [Candidatus Omnitrophota bacterium]
MLNKTKELKFYLIATLIYIVLYSIIHLGWIDATTSVLSTALQYRGYTADFHGLGVMYVVDQLKNIEAGNLSHLFNTHTDYPPLYYLTTAAIHVALGGGFDFFPLRIIAMFFSSLLLFVTFLYAQKAFSPRAGFFSCVLLSLYPQFYNYFSAVTPHIFLMLLVFLSLFFLQKSNDLHIPLYSILFGVTSGLSLFIKHEALFFLAGPWLFIIITRFLSKDKNTLKQLFVTAIPFLILFTVFFIYYIAPFAANLVGRSNLSLHPDLIDKGLFHFNSITFYVRNLFNCQLKTVFAILFILALPLYAKMKNPKKWPLLVYTFTPMVILTLITMKWPEYSMPILPAISIITVQGILCIGQKIRNGFIWAAIVSLCLFGLVRFQRDINCSCNDYQSNVPYWYACEQTITKLFDQLDTRTGKTYVTLIRCGCAWWLPTELAYRKIITQRNDIVLSDIMWSKYVIEQMKAADYVISHHASKEQDWPTLDNMHHRYWCQRGLVPLFSNVDFLHVVNARRYFKRIAVIKKVFINTPHYFFVFKNIREAEVER